MAAKKATTRTEKKSVAKSGTKVVESLIDVLSDTYVLAVKTHGYHWNVTGPFFTQLHELFSKQYEAMIEAADDIAERIRALDVPAPGGMKTFLSNSAVKEASGEPLTDEEMVTDLLHSHETLRDRVQKAAEIAGEADDLGTEDLLVGRLREHDKMIWMLRAQLD